MFSKPPVINSEEDNREYKEYHVDVVLIRDKYGNTVTQQLVVSTYETPEEFMKVYSDNVEFEVKSYEVTEVKDV